MKRALQWGLLLLCGVGSWAQAQPQLAGCQVYPVNHVLNARVDGLPVLANSSAMINTIGANRGLHMDFGSGLWDGAPIGIPFMVVNAPPMQPIAYTPGFGEDAWPEESDAGPFPIPLNAPVEGGNASTGDRHVLVLDQSSCLLYELYKASVNSPSSGWRASSGVRINLRHHALRPMGWTSADASGLPLLPGLIRYDEVAAGKIEHALRFTIETWKIRTSAVWPVRHLTFNGDAALSKPPMGQRFRLKASFNIQQPQFSPSARVILQALKEYGIFVADGGSDMYISGTQDERWDNDMLHELDGVLASDFEAVDVSGLMQDPDSAWVKNTPAPNDMADSDQDGLPNALEGIEGLNPNGKDNDIFADSTQGRRLFVMQQFRDLLYREPSSSALSYWSNKMNSEALSRTQLILAFWSSAPANTQIKPLGRLMIAYFGSLFVNNSVNAMGYWGRQLGSGAMSLNQISLAFVGGAAFGNKYGVLSDAQFVDVIYQNVWHRAANPNEQTLALSQITQLGRAAWVQSVVDAAAVVTALEPQLRVESLFVALGKKVPTATGELFWLDKVQANLNAGTTEMINAYLGVALPAYAGAASAYRNRFLPAAN